MIEPTAADTRRRAARSVNGACLTNQDALRSAPCVFDGRASAAGTRQSSLQGWIHGVPRIEPAGMRHPDESPFPNPHPSPAGKQLWHNRLKYLWKAMNLRVTPV